MDTLAKPPPLDVLVVGLERLLRHGLPATEETADDTLLSLRGVWARSIDPDDLLSRVKALNSLLRREVPRIPPYNGRDWAVGGLILFKLAAGTGKLSLSQRYQRAAQAIHYNEDHLRQEVVPKILRQLARQLHQDSQNYIPRGRATPELEISGDSPSITEEHLSSRERALHEERLSRLWECVYGLRAELIAAQRHEAWPDEEHAELKLQEARDSALWQLGRLIHEIRQYIADYGDRIMHGDAEFDVEALIRLSGWRGELSPMVANKLRILAAQHLSKEGFLKAAREAGLRAVPFGVEGLVSHVHD